MRAFDPMTAAALLAQPDEETPWILDTLLVAGDLAILSSAPKVGKSTFAYAAVVAMAQARPFMGLDTTSTPGGVLVLALEESQRSIRRRLVRFGMRAEDPIHVWAGPLSPNRLPDVKAFLASHSEIVLVVVDTLSRYWIGHVTEENSNAEVAAVTEPLLRLARDHKVCVLLLHHDRKNGDGSDPRHIRGAGDLFAVVDQALQLEKIHGSRRTLHVTGRYQDESPAQIDIDLVGDEYRLVVDGNTTKTAAALDGERWKTVQELSEETSQGRWKVNADLRALKGKVETSGRGAKGDPRRYRRAPVADDVGVGT